jgi:drug/metabolite transporter (DMT)-like permease
VTTGGERKRRDTPAVEAALLLTVFFFGTNFTAVKIVVDSVPPILFAASRFTLAGLLLLLFVPFSGRENRLRRQDFLPVLGLGIVGITLTQTVFTLGVSLTTAANTALVYSTAPVWGMLLGFVLGLERPRPAGVLGIGLSLLGVGFIVYGGWISRVPASSGTPSYSARPCSGAPTPSSRSPCSSATRPWRSPLTP